MQTQLPARQLDTDAAPTACNADAATSDADPKMQLRQRPTHLQMQVPLRARQFDAVAAAAPLRKLRRCGRGSSSLMQIQHPARQLGADADVDADEGAAADAYADADAAARTAARRERTTGSMQCGCGSGRCRCRGRCSCPRSSTTQTQQHRRHATRLQQRPLQMRLQAQQPARQLEADAAAAAATASGRAPLQTQASGTRPASPRLGPGSATAIGR